MQDRVSLWMVRGGSLRSLRPLRLSRARFESRPISAGSVRMSGLLLMHATHTAASVSLPIEAKKYLKALTEQCLLQFFVAVKVRESRQLFLDLQTLQLVIPEVEILCPSSIVRGEMVRVKLRFKNTLPYSLSRVLFLVQAQGLCPQREMSQRCVRVCVYV